MIDDDSARGVRGARSAAIAVQARPRTADHRAARGDPAGAARCGKCSSLPGDTGSGKSTQLPQYCLELGRGVAGLDRPHAAAAPGRASAGCAGGGGIGPSRRPQRGFRGALCRSSIGRDASGAHDGRTAAGGIGFRSAAAPLRHRHRRRGARAHSQRRFVAGRAQTAAAAPPGTETHRDLGDSGCRTRVAGSSTMRRSSRSAAAAIPIEVRYRQSEEDE